MTKEGVNRSLYRGLLKLTEQGRAAAEQISGRASLAVELADRYVVTSNRDKLTASCACRGKV